jgi:hypothetical protein
VTISLIKVFGVMHVRGDTCIRTAWDALHLSSKDTSLLGTFRAVEGLANQFLLCYVVQQGKVYRPRQILHILPAHGRPNLPLATGFQRVTSANTSSSHQ